MNVTNLFNKLKLKQKYMTMYDKNNKVVLPKKTKDKIERRIKRHKFIAITVLTLVALSFLTYGIYCSGMWLGDWIAQEFIVVSDYQKLSN